MSPITSLIQNSLCSKHWHNYEESSTSVFCSFLFFSSFSFFWFCSSYSPSYSWYFLLFRFLLSSSFFFLLFILFSMFFFSFFFSFPSFFFFPIFSSSTDLLSYFVFLLFDFSSIQLKEHQKDTCSHGANPSGHLSQRENAAFGSFHPENYHCYLHNSHTTWFSLIITITQ